jgi:hypothetical protein
VTYTDGAVYLNHLILIFCNLKSHNTYVKEHCFQLVINNISTRFQHQVINTCLSVITVKEYNILGINVKGFFKIFLKVKKKLFVGFFKGKMTK